MRSQLLLKTIKGKLVRSEKGSHEILRFAQDDQSAGKSKRNRLVKINEFMVEIGKIVLYNF